MLLAPGARLGPYEIVALLGTGGMGEVYRARDRRLARDVAIKILSPAFATDPERLRRFEQEARATAALNHPNILAIHDVGQSPAPAGLEGSGPAAPFIVSEVLEGETLRQALNRASGGRRSAGGRAAGPGALPWRKAVEYTVQIARGLAAAHEKGIVHRDLKPENVFVTAADHVKILDFGLAKLTEPWPDRAGVSSLPTAEAGAVTQPGAVLGTVGYMSPEQVRGLTADSRSDIFALGAILYEMVSGQRAFHGDTAADTMGAILSSTPQALQTAERQIPSALVRIVERCLEKSPTSRFQTTSDLAFAIDALSGATHTPELVAQAPRGSRLPWPWVVATAFLLVATAGLAAMVYLRGPRNDAPVYRSTISTPGATGNSQLGLPLALSPDGQRLAFVAPDAGGRAILWIRPLPGLTAQPLAGTEGAAAPFWSPDSREIAFFADGKLKKIGAAGGMTFELADASADTPGTWSREDVILFTPRYRSPLSRVSASGGTPSVVTTLDATVGETAHRYPAFLPDGRHFLYLAASITDTALGLYAGSLNSPERTQILERGSNAQYANGALLFLRDTTLMAQAFDVEHLAFSGYAVPLGNQIQSLLPAFTIAGIGKGAGVFSVSETGVLVYQAISSADSQLVWLDRSGQRLGVLGGDADYGDVFLSPDGLRASVSVAAPGADTRDIWTFDVARGLRTPLTFDAGDEFEGVWSPDGSRIVFSSNRNGRFDLFQKTARETGGDELLLQDDEDKFPQSWSPDGQFLLYIAIGASTRQDLWVLPFSGDRRSYPYIQTGFNEGYGAQFSPNGHWVAFSSDESGRNEVWVAPFPGPGERKLVSTGGGVLARWRRDGREIFYQSGNSLMAAAVDGEGSTFEVGAVERLYDAQLSRTRRYAYDVSSDGSRFLVNIPLEPAETAPLTLVVNWPTLLVR